MRDTIGGMKTNNRKNGKDATENEVIHITDDESWEPFDDCPICKAMEDGSADTLEGLLEAFKRAEKEGHRVGYGDEFELRKNIRVSGKRKKEDE